MESMTTTTDPLSPARVEAALEWADMCPIPPYRENVNACETLAVLARAHLDATKREPPAGLVAVIAQQIVATFPGSPQLPSAIARAVVEFATSDAAMDRVDAALGSQGDRIDDEARNIIRAALGATEAGNG